MAQADRLFGFDASLFTIANIGGSPVVRNCIAIFQNLEIQIDYELVENRAVMDSWAYPVTRIASWRASVAIAGEGTAGGASTSNPFDFASQSGTSVRMKAASSVSAATGNVGYDGIGIMSNFRHPMGEGGQVISFDLVGQGALAATSTIPA